MRRFISLVLIAACVLAQAALCVRAEEVPAARYEMDIRLLPAAQALTVRETVSYVNRTGARLTRLMFGVYPNCFRRESTLPYDNAALEAAFPYGYAPGGMEFSRLTVNGADADWGVQGENECYLRVACDLAPGQTAEIAMDYTLLLTENCSFLGTGPEEWRLTQFYPVLCTFADGDFVTNPLSRAGEWLDAPLSDYAVTVTLLADYEIAAAGEIRREESENGLAVYTISLNNARSFAMAVSHRFHRAQGESALGTRVSVYGQSRPALKKALREAISALDALEKRFGALPWGEIALVDAHSARSLAATGVIMIAHDTFADAEARAAEIRYQLARQYFQELAHVNPALSPWLFEALSEYTALLIVRDTAGESAFARAVDSALRPALQITVPGGYSVNAFAPLFSTQREYEIVVRERGAAVLNELRKAMGIDSLWRALRIYVDGCRFRRADAEDFLSALAEATGRGWDDALISWFHTIDDYTRETLDHYE